MASCQSAETCEMALSHYLTFHRSEVHKQGPVMRAFETRCARSMLSYERTADNIDAPSAQAAVPAHLLIVS